MNAIKKHAKEINARFINHDFETQMRQDHGPTLVEES